MEKIIKKYTNGEVTVIWQPGECIHSRICFEKATGLPEVFNPQVRPWINMDGADTERIIAQVKKCPTQALSFVMNGEEDTVGQAEEEVRNILQPEKRDVIIQVMKNGPLLVYGNVVIKEQEGRESVSKNITSFCRCGASKTNPYCDGTHFDVDFKDKV